MSSEKVKPAPPRARTGNALVVTRAFIIKKGVVLLIRRAEDARRNPGMWEVPGGMLKFSETIHQGIVREVLEETGLAVNPVNTITHSDSEVLRGDGRYEGLTRVILFGFAVVAHGHLALSHEHDEYRWCSYGEMLTLNLTQATRRAAIVLERQIKAHCM